MTVEKGDCGAGSTGGDMSAEDRRSFLKRAAQFGAMGAGGVFLMNDVTCGEELVDPVTGVIAFVQAEGADCLQECTKQCDPCPCETDPCTEQECHDSCTSCTCGEECPTDCESNCTCGCNCYCRCICFCGCGCPTGATKVSLQDAAAAPSTTTQKDTNTSTITTGYGANLKGPESQMNLANQNVTDAEGAMTEIKYNSMEATGVNKKQVKRATDDVAAVNLKKAVEQEERAPGDAPGGESQVIGGAYEVVV